MLKLLTSAFAAAAVLVTAGSAAAADNCNDDNHQSVNWSSKFDDVWPRIKGWQFPRSSFCIGDWDRGFPNLGYPGALTKDGSNMRFRVTDGDDGRAELRFDNFGDNTGTMWANLKINSDVPGRQFSVAQLFSDGAGPIVRLEVDGVRTNNTIRAVIKTSPRGSTVTKHAFDIKKGDSVIYWMNQWVSGGNHRIKINMRKNGGSVKTVYDGTVDGYTPSKSYFKAGCYMNNSTEKDGCDVTYFNMNPSRF